MGPQGYGPPEEQISPDRAETIAKEYAENHLKGFSVERVLPFTGMHHQMYGAELKGPNGETRYLHITPWGGVAPFFGGAWRSQ